MGLKPGRQLRRRKRAPMVMRMIGKTRETLLGLPSWAMAHLRYLVLRTRKKNSSVEPMVSLYNSETAGNRRECRREACGPKVRSSVPPGRCGRNIARERYVVEC